MLLHRISQNLKEVSAKKENKTKKVSKTEAVLSKVARKRKSCEQPQTCNLCGKVTASRRNMKDHLNRFHLKSKKMFCDLCPKFYFTKVGIRHHVTIHFSNQPFACNLCEYKTMVKGNLTRHIIGHNTKAECQICNKEVSFMRDHMLTHGPRKSCSFCQKMVCKRQMRDHMRDHGRKVENQKVCETCGKTLESKEELRV